MDVGRIDESAVVFQKTKVKLRHTEQPTQHGKEAAFILSPQPILSPPPGALAIEVTRPGTVTLALSLSTFLSPPSRNCSGYSFSVQFQMVSPPGLYYSIPELVVFTPHGGTGPLKSR